MLGERIAELRKGSGMTQEDLAEALNISRSTLAGYEAENKKLSFDVTLRIAKHFGVTTDYLLGVDGGEKNMKNGGYSAVYWDTLDEDERSLIEGMPKDEEQLLIEQIQLFSVRERRIMKAINKYRNSESPVALAFSQRSEQKRAFENDEDKEEYARRIAEKVAAGKRLPGNEYSVITQTDNKDQIIARLESELSNVQSKKTKAIEALSKMHIEHQKLDGGNKGNDVIRMWAEKVLQNRRDSDG